LSRSANNQLGSEDLVELSQRVFDAEGTSLRAAAGKFDLQTLSSALADLMDMVSEVIEALPDSAFQPQPDDVDGSDVWSAGDVIGHLAQMELAALPYWEAVTDVSIPSPSVALLQVVDQPPVDARTATDAIGNLKEQSARTMKWVARNCSGDESGVHFAIGPATAREALLGSCIHLADHHQQLLALAAHQGSSL